MRVAVYIRVSTDDQASSAEAQESGALAWCAAQGHEVVATYRDIGHSGAEWVRRPAEARVRAGGGAGASSRGGRRGWGEGYGAGLRRFHGWNAASSSSDGHVPSKRHPRSSR